MLRDAIAFALRGVKVQLGRRFLRLGLTEEQRYGIGEQVVRDLKKYNDPWKLEENVPEQTQGPRWENGKPPGA
jgi:hypothetical protein